MASTGFGAAFRQLRGLFDAGSVVGMGDAQLLARYAGSKDEAAFEALVSRHGPMVLTICRAVLRNEHDVEDAFQATFLVLARKAGSIRGGDSLAGWLHRVAYRASVQAGVEARKRRRKEAEASALSRMTSGRVGPDLQLAAILHEEVDRLPERQRLPVVLCDLEGLTSQQAALHLRWTEPTVRHRLADGRKRLRARLTRRGMTAPAIGHLPVASAAVPPSLARMALSAATGGPVPAGPATLAHTLLRGMLMTQIKIASAAALMALASAGLIAAGAGRPEDPKPAMKPKVEAKAVAREEPAAKKPVEMVEVKGRVVAPDGQPVAGARVRAVSAEPPPGTTSGPDGRFTIRLPKPTGGVPQDYDMDRYPWLLASAPGFGLGWTERVLRADRPAEEVVTLTEEGTPIEGRLIDLEGQAVVDARVKVDYVSFEAKGDLSGWIAKARNGAVDHFGQGLDNLPLDQILAIDAKTGPDGRFRLTGLGRDRIASLMVSGPGVATTQIRVLCNDEPEIRGFDKQQTSPKPFIIHGPKFQIPLAPNKRVEGIARDQDTGRPIAGLQINAAVFDEYSLIKVRGIEARTDAEGRYRLDGLPRAPAYRLFFSPGPGLPYTNSTLKAPADSPAMEPVAFDFTLKRGVLVRGRVTDKATGRPVRGHVNYYAFADNPHVRKYPGFMDGYESVAYIDKNDGSFELVALPGRGLIGIRAEEERHKGAVANDKIPGYDAGLHGYKTVPSWCGLDDYHIIAEVNLDPKAEPARLEFQADPGKSVAIEVVDPDGKPLGGTTVKGKADLFQSSPYPEEAAGFEIHALDPAKPRRVVVTHEARKLIGSVVLKGDEPGPVTIRLAPWGAVAGRIVDDEGRPRKAMPIWCTSVDQRLHPETDGDFPGGDQGNGIAVGNDGLFRIERLVPGLRYGANTRPGSEASGDLFTDLTVAPGEVKDLGDIKAKPPKR